jgi:hypothetical protein
MEQELERRMREQGLIPLETVNNRRRRDRLRNFGRNRSGIPAPIPGSADSVRNRRKRQRSLSIDDTSSVPFARVSLGGGPNTSTPRSPNSLRTAASSTVTSSRGASGTRIPRTSESQPLLPAPFSPRPISAPQQPRVATLPRAVLANRPNKSLHSQETPGGNSGAESLLLRVERSDTSHSLRFYRDEQKAIQQHRKEALFMKASLASLVYQNNLIGER